jgi:hypothetical protein
MVRYVLYSVALKLEVKLMFVLCVMCFQELDRDAGEETIKMAYKRLAKFYHRGGWFVSPFSTFPVSVFRVQS